MRYMYQKSNMPIYHSFHVQMQDFQAKEKGVAKRKTSDDETYNNQAISGMMLGDPHHYGTTQLYKKINDA